jgi:copper chaperone
VLEKIAGVNQVDVSLEQAQATIQFDAAETGVDQLKLAIEEAGFDVIG